jgi:LysM repeat protein
VKTIIVLIISAILLGCLSGDSLIVVSPKRVIANHAQTILDETKILTPIITESILATATPTPSLIPTTTIIPTLTPTPTVTPTTVSTYTVQTGDALQIIANRFTVPLTTIAWLNGISNYDLIYVGQILQIPASNTIITPPKPIDISEKEIIVILSSQRVYAYEKGVLVNTFIVSTGIKDAPTVIGDYKIYLKIVKQRMTGPGYDLPDVPWVMYFFRGYSFHGTYWHHNFGVPMSHGCVNMVTSEAEWLYGWAQVGTTVTVNN